MTPEDQDPQLSAEDEERVRRVLAASAPGPEAMPHEVAARLDDVLAQLVAERGDGSAPATGPTDPAAGDELARRRRRGPRLLLAAASVAALAVGSGVVLHATSNSGSGSASTASAGSAEQDSVQADKPTADRFAPDSAGAPGAATPRDLQVAVPLPRLHTASLDADVRRAAAREVRSNATKRAGRPAAGTAAGVPCALPAPVRGGRLLAVRLDGERATLLLGPERDGARVARVYSCGDGVDPVAETSVTIR